MGISGKVKKGLLLGMVADTMDVIPMIIQSLTLDANLSAFAHGWLRVLSYPYQA